MEDFIAKQKQLRRMSVLFLLAIIGLMLYLLSSYTVKTGEVAIVSRFGKVSRVDEAGLHFKIPFIESKKIFITREQTLKFGNYNSADESPLSSSTKDLQTVEIELTVSTLTIDPMSLYNKFLGNHVRSLMIPRIKDSVQTHVAKFTIEEFVSQRDQLSKSIYDDLKEEFGKYGLEVTNVSITNHDFSDTYEKAVEDKKVAEQAVETAKREQEKKIVEREAAVTLAELELQKKELEAKANAVESSTLTKELLTKLWLEKWDGKLPQIVGQDGSLLISPEGLEN